MIKKIDTKAARVRRHARVRKNISGTAERPRLNVFRSAKHIYAQVIDDVKGVTLVSASSMDKEFEGYGGNVEGAKAIGQKVAEKALAAGIKAVVFDRGGYVFRCAGTDMYITAELLLLQKAQEKAAWNSNRRRKR